MISVDMGDMELCSTAMFLIKSICFVISLRLCDFTVHIFVKAPYPRKNVINKEETLRWIV